MKISATTKVEVNHELVKTLEGVAKSNALFKTADWILTEVIASGKVPMDTGELQVSGYIKQIEENIVSVIFDTPYARRWYFNTEGVTFNKSKNANATDHWMDDFIHGDRKPEVIEMYASFYREEIGGLLK